MRKRRFRHTGDSLDLLLDTICNTFGGIIFIACLVTLLARESNTKPNPAVERADLDMLKRRISVALDDLARLDAVVEQQDIRRASAAALAARKLELEAEITSLRARALQAGDSAPGGPPTGELLQLREQNRPLRMAVERLLNSITASEKETTRLLKRQQELAKQTAELTAQSREKLRFPKEGQTEKTPYWVILKHGHIYPIRNDDGELNETTLTWEHMGSRGSRVIPRASLGAILPGDDASLAAQLRSLAAGRQYLTVSLFPDSYDTWRDYRRLIQNAGLDYGLMFFEKGDDLILGSSGSVPPPL